MLNERIFGVLELSFRQQKSGFKKNQDRDRYRFKQVILNINGPRKQTYQVDPLLCPKCLGSMRIISFISDSEIIRKILKHLDL